MLLETPTNGRPAGSHPLALGLGSGVDRTPRALDLSEVWYGLLAGRVFLSEAGYAADRAYVSLARPVACRRIAARDAKIVERVLRGERPKTLAWELKVAPSRIATRCTNVLRAIGYEHLLPHTSILLVMAAHAASGLPLTRARLEDCPGDDHYTVSVENPARSLRRFLSPSEYAVARLAVEGKNYRTIAALRETSARTVANQLASAFRKLGVSGRCELRARAVREHALRGA